MAKGGEGVFRCKVGAAAMGNSLYVVIHKKFYVSFTLEFWLCNGPILPWKGERVQDDRKGCPYDTRFGCPDSGTGCRWGANAGPFLLYCMKTHFAERKGIFK